MKKSKAYNYFFAFLYLLPVLITLAYWIGCIVAGNQTGNAPVLTTFTGAWNTTCENLGTVFGNNTTLRTLLSNFLTAVGFSVGTGATFIISWLLNISLIRLVCDIFYAVFGWVHSKF